MTNPDKASSFTSLLHKNACCDPAFDWQNRQDFEFAGRGLMHRPDDPDFRDSEGEIVWHHETYESFLHGARWNTWAVSAPVPGSILKTGDIAGRSRTIPRRANWLPRRMRSLAARPRTQPGATLTKLESMFDQFPAWLPIATHDPKFEEAELLP